ncbi:MAG: twin-arginine translocation signal domain-containing protein, partial [Chloroflexota bacterium]
MTHRTRRDFLKLGGLSLGALAFSPLASGPLGFDDVPLLRIATDEIVARREPTDDSPVVSRWVRDELLHIYGEAKGVDGEPKHNPVWYRVWGGYIHRGRVQRVKILYNKPIEFIPEGTRQLMEVTVPYTTPYRNSKARGWEKIDQTSAHTMIYGSVHWVDAIEP